MTFQDAVKLINHNNGNLTLNTLGGKKEIIFSIENNYIRIKNSKNKTKDIDEKFFGKVINRIESLDLNLQIVPSCYTSPNWGTGNPDTVFAPYVVPLYFHWLSVKNINNNSQNDFEKLYRFEMIGSFKIIDNKPSREVEDGIQITQRLDLVYAFFVDGRCKYIGKTIQGYTRPLNYHKNKKMVNAYNGILKTLDNNQTVEILIRKENNSLIFEGLSLSLIESIERALIAIYSPEWNILGI